MLRTVTVVTVTSSLVAYVDLATAQRSAPNNLFTAAGFVVRYADTPEQMALLRRLPPDKLVTRMRGGTVYYLYADPNICQCAYIGTSQAFQAYQVGSEGTKFNLGGGESRGDQMLDEFSEADEEQPGAPSFNDYVFGGIDD